MAGTVYAPLKLSGSRVEAEHADASRVVLQNVSWDTYESLLSELAEQHFRLTYDGGVLEIMSPSPRHDRSGRLLGRLIHAYTEILDIPIASFGTTTWRRRDLGKGLEADECYYVNSEPMVRGRDDVHLPEDPPPDLAVEVDISRSALDKQEIYARLGIPELWRYEGDRLLVYALNSRGRYIQVQKSRSFPLLPLGQVEQFMRQRQGQNETAWIKSFRHWVSTSLQRKGRR